MPPAPRVASACGRRGDVRPTAVGPPHPCRAAEGLTGWPADSCNRGRGLARFVYIHSHVSGSFDTVAAKLDETPGRDASRMTAAAGAPRCRGVSRRCRRRRRPPPSVDRVRVRLGPATAHDEARRLPRQWTEAVTLPQLLSTLVSEIAAPGAHEQEPSSVQRHLSASGWQLGEVADGLAGHRVAEACLRRFAAPARWPAAGDLRKRGLRYPGRRCTVPNR